MKEELVKNAPDIIKAAAESPLGIVALAIIAITIVAMVLFGRANDRVRLGAFVVFLIGVGLLVLQVIKQSQDAHGNTSTGQAGEPSVFLECQAGPLPKQFPPDGRIYAVKISRPSERIGLMNYFGPPGAAFEIVKGALLAYQCKITHYGNEPIFNVALTLQTRYLEALGSSAGSKQTGKVIGSNERLVLIAKLDSGPDRAFSFYILSLGQDFFSEVSLPETVTFEAANEATRHEQRLILPNAAAPIFLSPFDQP